MSTLLEWELCYQLALITERREQQTITYWADRARKCIAEKDVDLAGAWARNAAYLALKVTGREDGR